MDYERMKGEDIKRLIPQRNPMMMVDEFEARDGNSAVTALTVRPDNMFVYGNGELAESGLIEHIAQSASALAGFQACAEAGTTRPPVGLIGEVKHFECCRRPVAGDRIETTVTFGFSFGNATLVHGVSCVGSKAVAEAQLKIFIQ